MRRISHTSVRQGLPIALGIALILVAAAVLFTLMLRVEPDFFDDEAVVGVPTFADADVEVYGYETYDAIGVAKAALCGMPETINGRDVRLFLTNPADNTVAIRVEIYTPRFVQKSDGTYDAVPDVLLGESGFIRPGEYVEFLHLDRKLKTERTNVMIKIATLDESTGRSNGYFFVNTVLVK